MKERAARQPSPEELAAAESMMTPEQQAASAEREAAKFQERAAFFETAD